VRFRLAQACTTRIDVIDAAGRLVRTLHDGEAAAGEHAIAWDGRTSAGGTAAAGAYRVRLVAGGRVESVPLIVFR
jgi:flagellar basal-body rod modification protein FlgD